jgi:thioredoxin reductase (NADPH)
MPLKKLRANPKIEFVMESELRGYFGNEKLEKVTIEHLPTGEITEMKTDGVFVFIGYLPNTEPLKGIVSLNERNEIIVNPDMETNIPGVFAAGDCITKKYRQVTTAVAEGTIASLSASNYLRG